MLGGEQDAVDGGYAPNQDFNGDIAEIIMFNTYLTDPDRLIVENYLSQKYNVDITNDFFGNTPNYSAIYFTDLRGIGSDGTNARTDSQASDALTLLETNGSLDADEYVMLAHNNTLHANNITTEIADATNITDRWARDWYVEVNQGGGASGVDGGDVSAEMVFDFTTAGFANPSTPNDYVLLYRSTATGDFDRVFADSYTLEDADKVVVSVPASRLKTGYYTLGTGNQLLVQTWYVFQDGNWSNPSTWTTDASTAPLFNNPGNEVPAPADEVIIRSGRTVTIQPGAGNNNKTVNSIKVDGNLNVTTTTGHNFGTINGSGVIRLAGYTPGTGRVDNFPGGVTAGNIGFADADNGGTVVINASFDITLDKPRTFRNLEIKLTDATKKVLLGEDLTLNGTMTITQGGFQFGTATGTANRTLTVAKDVSVAAPGRISTANTNQRHRFNLEGNFTNRGTVRFTNRANFASDADRRNPGNDYYRYEASDNTNTTTADDGIVDVVFTNDNADQTANFLNTTYFYRIVIDKGVDATYKLLLGASSANHFRLLGFADDNVDSDGQTEAQNTNAFALINGTAEVGGNVEIPVLNRNVNYAISSSTQLWINGGDVRKTSTTAIVPYGTVRVSSGYLEATGNSGLTLRQNGLIRVEGGRILTNQIRTSIQGAGSLGGYNQSGGDVVVDGDLGGASGDYYVFSLTYTGNIFIMSGGSLTVSGSNGRGAVFINSDPGNVNVTGGRVTIESSNSNIAKITSRAPFYNVFMRATQDPVAPMVLSGGTSGSGGGAATLAAQPLRVINDLIVHGYNDTYYNNPLGNFPIVFSPVTSATDINDVYIGGSFYVGRNSNYQCLFGGTTPYDANGDAPTHYNTTHFNQTVATSAMDTVYIGDNRLETGNFVLDRTTGNELRTIARTGNNGGIRFDINGDMSVLSGTLDQNAYTFRIWGNITNQDRLGTYYSSGVYPTVGGTPSVAQIRMREGNSGAISITTTDNATFGNIRFNVGDGETVEFDSDVYIERMEYMNGRIYVKDNTLTVDEIWNINNGGGNYFNGNVASSSIIQVPNNGATGNILIFTDGKASDGGLRLKIRENTVAEDETSRINNDGPITFPVGFTPDGGTTLISRPAQMKVKDFADTGYVRINVVSGELQTSELSGGEILQHYWRVRHDGFTAVPKVAFRFYYRDQVGQSGRDLPLGASNESDYVPGYVLDGGTYDRYFESDPTEDKTDIYISSYQVNTRVITFNGSSTGGEFSQGGFAGFPLTAANYTAGEANRFVGAPQIFYSNEDGSNADWDEGASWNSDAEITADPVGSAGVTDEHDDDINQIAGNVEGEDYPGAGDIAVLGVGPDTGTPHSIRIERGITAGAAELRFVENATITQAGRGGFAFKPELTINSSGGSPTLAISSIKGVGIISDRANTDPVFSSVDLGDYVNQSESFYLVENFQANATYQNLPAALPHLLITSDGFGNNNRTTILANDHEIKGDLLIVGGANLALNNDNANPADGDLVINGNLQLINGYEVFPAGQVMGDNGGADPELFFPGSNGGSVPSRSVEVYGNLILTRRGSSMTINNAGGNNASHTLSIYGNITDNSTDTDGGIDLYENTDHVKLIAKGNNSVVYSRTNTNASSIPELYTFTINKTDITNEISVDTDIDLPLPTNINQQPIEILNGTLILNDPGIDVTLTDASTGNFLLPNTTNPAASSGSGGLELRQGVARIQGDNTGLLLDGLLRISGGELDMDDATNNGNNFIEYSSSGQARIEVTDGTLTVGSQIRRGLNATTGVLQYAQSGGTVLVGKNAAPASTRGLFEITNAGSSFEYTGGSFTIARDNNSTTVPSLLLDPASSNVADKTIITIGNTDDTPTNQDRFGIRSSSNVARLAVASAHIDASVYGVPLSADSLSIITGATFNANGYDLTINKFLVNDGDLTTDGNTTNNQHTYFPSAGASAISGSGTTTFWNFTKSGGGTLSLFEGRDRRQQRLCLRRNAEYADQCLQHQKRFGTRCHPHQRRHRPRYYFQW